MAQKRKDTLTDSYLEGERRSEPVPEREIDEARRAGHGIAERSEETRGRGAGVTHGHRDDQAEIERGGSDRPTHAREGRDLQREVQPTDREDAEVTRRYREGESVDEHRRVMKTRDTAEDRQLSAPEHRGDVARHTTADEAREARLRASGHFETEAERTQTEEDFGERGLRYRGGVHDATHNPSILDPEPED